MRIMRGGRAVFLAALVVAVLGAAGPDDLPFDPVATFSILGYDPGTGEVGGAVAGFKGSSQHVLTGVRVAVR